jgi:hypothetical protein
LPKIFEIFGYRLNDKSSEAQNARTKALCPFMGKPCDGGGNRFASHIHLKETHPLREHFDPAIEKAPSGVCSIQTKAGESPWIVCPRRLLSFDRSTSALSAHDALQSAILAHSGFRPGVTIGVWAEVKIKVKSSQAGASNDEDSDDRNFDYTFDYVLFSLGRVRLDEVSAMAQLTKPKTRTALIQSGFTLALRDGTDWVEDFPVGPPTIIEIMTSSTSGGNKTKRTTIPMAFEDAIKGAEHQAPGINYRQVWARMVSQLIVKSEVGIAWGGRTFWVLQDLLVDYISESTKLNIRQFLSQVPSEVNIVTMGYDKSFIGADTDKAALTNPHLYAGPIAAEHDDLSAPSFEDIIHVGEVPQLSKLLSVIMKKPRTRTIRLPQ